MQALSSNVCKQHCGVLGCRAWTRCLKDLKLGFHVHQSAGRFIGSKLATHPPFAAWKPLEKCAVSWSHFASMLKNLGKQSEYWRYSPVHLEDAWKRFQSAVAEAWRTCRPVDSAAILQKICSRYEAQAPFRMCKFATLGAAAHGTIQDKNRNRPWSLRDRNPYRARLECWERRQMAMEDKNKHRPQTICEKGILLRRLECWEPAADVNGRQERTSTQENAKEGILLAAWSVGSGGTWHCRTRTSIVPRSCDRTCRPVYQCLGSCRLSKN